MAKRLTHQERINFLAILMRVARADDVSPVERDRLKPVPRWLGATDEEMGEAVRRANEESVELTELIRLDSERERLLLFREACGVVWVDGKKSLAEDAILDRLALLLDLSDKARAVLDSPLACSPEGERRFLELLGGTSLS